MRDWNPAFKAPLYPERTLVALDPAPAPLLLVVVVDVANVMGARADGWWRDRAGAALRLCQEVAALGERGIPADRLPPGQLPPGQLPPTRPETPDTEPVFPRYVLVLEGRAREAAARFEAPHQLVRIVLAPGSGDDSIAAEAAAAAVESAPCLVVTADRELRERCRRAGAAVAGPGWLLGLL